MEALLFRPTPKVIRASVPPLGASERSHQAWYEDMLQHNWSASKKATDRLAGKHIGVQQWADDFHSAIVNANANAHWIGRDLVADKPTKFEPKDVLAGRTIADDDAEYLQGFIDDIVNGRYLKADGTLDEVAIYNRQRLYMGRVRGIAAQASVDDLDRETEIYWRLGGTERHCTECPQLASLSPFYRDDLFATPGSGDTPCLGNCRCHLEFVVGDATLTTIKPVELEL